MAKLISYNTNKNKKVLILDKKDEFFIIDDQLIEILNGISKDEIIVVDATKNDKLSS